MSNYDKANLLAEFAYLNKEIDTPEKVEDLRKAVAWIVDAVADFALSEAGVENTFIETTIDHVYIDNAYHDTETDQ